MSANWDCKPKRSANRSSESASGSVKVHADQTVVFGAGARLVASERGGGGLPTE